MNFGRNLSFLRRLHNNLSQEDLAEIIGVSRQTVSKWESNTMYPEIDKIIQLCDYFSCSMDQLIRGDLFENDEAYIKFRVENVPSFYYVKYTVISCEPEEDALNHVRDVAQKVNCNPDEVIGWDFTSLSIEQVNVYHMRGYTAALVSDKKEKINGLRSPVYFQEEGNYAVVTVKDPFHAPLISIPNAYKALNMYIEENGLKYGASKDKIPYFEKSYVKNGTTYMDIYIAIE